MKFLLFILVSVFSMSQTAAACSCFWEGYEKAFKETPIVFEGVVINNGPELSPDGELGPRWVATFKVTRTIKGTEQETRIIHYALHDGGNCSQEFSKDFVYQVFATPTYQNLFGTGSCGGTVPLHEVGAIRPPSLDPDADRIVGKYLAPFAGETPSGLRDLKRRARHARRYGDHERAAEAYGKAFELDNDNQGLLAAYIDALVELYKFEAAFEVLNDADSRLSLRKKLRHRLAHLSLIVRGNRHNFQSDYRKLYLPFDGPTIDFKGGDFSDTDFSESRLNKVMAASSDLQRINLREVSFLEVDFSNADLSGADLRGARLGSSFFEQPANFKGALLTDALLTNTKVDGANFSGANLAGVKIKDGSWSKIIAQGTDFSGAQFGILFAREADLRGANLKGASMHDVNLFKARFEGADLRGVTLSGYGRFDQASFDCATRFPEGFDPIKKGMVNIDGTCSPD
ncbi:MAG: pentapeptide repeat-containing protein [Pseudomonadota bacterium]